MDVKSLNELNEALGANSEISIIDSLMDINCNNNNFGRSLLRSPSLKSNGSIFCRICHQNESFELKSDLISPCNCSGSMANVHQHCLQRWASIASTSVCDICGFNYNCRQKFPSILKVTLLLK
jgi:hypothetical protein